MSQLGSQCCSSRKPCSIWSTDKKEYTIFLIYKGIQMGAVEKSYMRKGFLIYEEMSKYLVIYEEAVSYIWLCNRSLLDFIVYEDFFYSVELHPTVSQTIRVSWLATACELLEVHVPKSSVVTRHITKQTKFASNLRNPLWHLAMTLDSWQEKR